MPMAEGKGFALSRRRFLGWGPAAALAAAVPFRASAVTARPVGEDYYAKLGVQPIINAAGTYTYLTAAVMPPSVRRAVERAAYHPVRLKDLQRASGEYLARKLHCEAALVSSGASAALTLATAACIAKANGLPPEAIPDRVAGRKNEIVVQKAHRYEYDHAMQLCNVVIKEVVNLSDYRAALNDQTVMTNFFNAAEGGEIGREEWLRVAHKQGVPCHLDAAADVPPIENLWKYTGMGFDLVCFSGGKGIRGPQNAGLLLGRKDLIELAAQNGNPNSDAVGRGMKVAKEQIVGMVAAVDWLLAQSDEGMEAEFLRRTAVIQKALEPIPFVKTRVFTPPIANHVPHLIIDIDPEQVGMSPLQVAEELRNGAPSIELNPATGTDGRGLTGASNSIVLSTWMLEDGEEHAVAARLRAVLTKARAQNKHTTT
jgi:L-seryl-tRNA(Ser) seleniumtransferase